MKLEMRHLAPYLPYGIRFFGKRKDWVSFDSNEMILCPIDLDGRFDIIKPALRPLSDLFNDRLNPIPINELQMQYGWDYLFYNVYKKKEVFNINELKWACLTKLFEWHFDVFGLIPAGLAIDINTLPKQ